MGGSFFFGGNRKGIEALAKPIFARGASPFNGSGPAAPFNGSGTAAPFNGCGTAARIWFGYLNFYLDWNLGNFKI